MQHSKHPRGRPPRKKHASNIQHLRKKSIHSRNSPEFESDTEEDMGDILRWDPHAGLKPSLLDSAASENEIQTGEELPKHRIEKIKDVMVEMLEDVDLDDL